MGRALLACFRSARNVARFYKLRDEIGQTKSVPEALKLVDQLESVAGEELENARKVLPLIYRDSRLGYANCADFANAGVLRAGIELK